MFKPASTWNNPASPQSLQRGQPAVGQGAQTTGRWTGRTPPPPAPELQPAGTDTWTTLTSASTQRGYEAPFDPGQQTTRSAQPFPQPLPVLYNAPWPDRGADNFSPDFGQVTSNPIGGGVQVSNPFDVHARGPAGQYFTDTIFWTSQVIPTSLDLQGLATPAEINAMVANLHVFGATPY